MSGTVPPPHRGRARRTGHWSLAVVGVLAGILFATNARLFAEADTRRPENLVDLVRVERDRLEQTNADVIELRAEVADLVASADEFSQAGPDPEVEYAAGRSAVTGPGVVVKLWDAPRRDTLPPGVQPDDLVVHQQDLEGVMNGLWAGGAEAMTVQGHRVTATSSIRCVGNVLLIDGSVYSPPYAIAAIGDPAQLRRVLVSSAPVALYLDYVEALQLGWSLDEESELEFPAAEGSIAMAYAHKPGQEPITLPTTEPSPANGSTP
ncbi:DUF881 domain-containing protein [Pseudactinotalea sp. HY160]|uniref:DUF881 domain-containing protein n=1 Tax=Pseudactinotalea sp. HY160 TaxID=2654490 RepID=UPI00128D620D|nr:DUF881 domain-containing protein [Pseudactinotalea sp. HY160]MPV49194.1 DUF881 domain-containing protein [Pseudactinotalea sp. HY160]